MNAKTLSCKAAKKTESFCLCVLYLLVDYKVFITLRLCVYSFKRIKSNSIKATVNILNINENRHFYNEPLNKENRIISIKKKLNNNFESLLNWKYHSLDIKEFSNVLANDIEKFVVKQSHIDHNCSSEEKNDI